VYPHDLLAPRIERQPFEPLRLRSGRPFQVDDQLQVLARTQRGLSKNGPDIEDAETAHLEEIPKQLGTAAFHGFRTDAVELHHIVRDEATAAAYQLQGEL